jgi:hypothetical protein
MNETHAPNEAPHPALNERQPANALDAIAPGGSGLGKQACPASPSA